MSSCLRSVVIPFSWLVIAFIFLASGASLFVGYRVPKECQLTLVELTLGSIQF